MDRAGRSFRSKQVQLGVAGVAVKKKKKKKKKKKNGRPHRGVRSGVVDQRRVLPGGHDVPSRAATAHVVDRGEPAGQVVRVVVGGGGGGDQADAFGGGRDRGEQRGGLQRPGRPPAHVAEQRGALARAAAAQQGDELIRCDTEAPTLARLLRPVDSSEFATARRQCEVDEVCGTDCPAFGGSRWRRTLGGGRDGSVGGPSALRVRAHGYGHLKAPPRAPRWHDRTSGAVVVRRCRWVRANSQVNARARARTNARPSFRTSVRTLPGLCPTARRSGSAGRA